MKLFYSYSHMDERLRDNIEKHLVLLKDEGFIDEWHDRKIQPGQVIHEEIDKHLETSDLILLLLSQDFLASQECKREMIKALEVREKNNAIVVPVIVRPCTWKDQREIVNLLAIPTDGKPITQWDDEDKAFLDVYENVKTIVKEIPIRIKADFKNDLTRVEFVSQHKENIDLDDLFVFPNIEAEYSDRHINKFADLWNKSKYVVLKGDDRSGKTVFCRKLFLDGVDGDTSSLLISGSDIRSRINHERVIDEKIREQFIGNYSHWTSNQSKLLIIDDFSHNTPLPFVDFAKGYFERVLIVISEDDYLAYFNDEEMLADFELLSLKSLGHSKQEELIKKWANLSDDQNHHQTIPHGKIDQIEDRLNSIILHSRIVPRYPFYILSILQTFEAFMPQTLQITAYGHCYQALITAQLINLGISKEDIDSALNFLTSFAFEIFVKRRESSQVHFEQFLEAYEAEYVIKKSVVNRLINHDSSIVRNRDGKYEFNYPFIYYFLLGNFFARNYEGHLDLIEQFAEKSYLKDYAYILIFTIHHTQDDQLIDTILLHTACALDHAPAATLKVKETKLLETALKELPERIISKRSIDEARRSERELRDETDTESADPLTVDGPDEGDLLHKDLNDFNKALKNMEILGQILRNKYGSLPRRKIEEIIEFVTDAGLRLIGTVTDQDSIMGIEGFFVEVLKNADISEDDKQKIERFLRRNIRTLVFIIIGSLLTRIVMSIRKPELLEIVESLYQEKDTPAFDLLYAFFVLETSEKLSSSSVTKIKNTLKKFDQSHNTVAQRLLSLSTQHYANTHYIRHGLRETLFQALRIDYRPNPLKNQHIPKNV